MKMTGDKVLVALLMMVRADHDDGDDLSDALASRHALVMGADMLATLLQDEDGTARIEMESRVGGLLAVAEEHRP